jgi:hypothetical protein
MRPNIGKGSNFTSFPAEAALHKKTRSGMFKLAPERKNREIAGSLHHLQSARYAGIFISVQKHMNISEIEPAKGFPAQLASSLSRSRQNISQVLRHTLR